MMLKPNPSLHQVSLLPLDLHSQHPGKRKHMKDHQWIFPPVAKGFCQGMGGTLNNLGWWKVLCPWQGDGTEDL